MLPRITGIHTDYDHSTPIHWKADASFETPKEGIFKIDRLDISKNWE